MVLPGGGPGDGQFELGGEARGNVVIYRLPGNAYLPKLAVSRRAYPTWPMGPSGTTGDLLI